MSLSAPPFRNVRPLIVGGLFAGSGLAFLVAARQYDSGSALHMGPGYFPTLVAGLLVIVGLLNIAAGFRGEEREGLPRLAWRPLLVVSASVVAFSLLIATAGLVPAIAGLILVSLFAAGRPTWREAVGVVVVVEVICVVIFHLILGLQVELVRL